MASRTRGQLVDVKQPPGRRGIQRGSREQLDGDPHPAREDEPTAWERGQQERLPPRGEGSQQNQGDDKDTRTVRDEVTDDTGPIAIPIAQGGGARGPGKAP